MTTDAAERVTALKRRLQAGEVKIGVWGAGFIGFSTMAYFANRGIKTVCYDIDEQRVEAINEGAIPINNLEYWLGFETEPLVEDGLMEATTDETAILNEDVLVHLIAVPTEKDGKPWDGALSNTIETLTRFSETEFDAPRLVVVESTLTPGMADDVVMPILEESALSVGEDIFFGVAPRRDWFISPDKNLESLPRVYGGQDEFTADFMESVLGIVCQNLVRAPDYQHAELVKSIENAYRHVGITLANQLSAAYPDIDMREVLRLVGTKWNIPTYHPSVGTGGYCIPLSSQYVLQGTDQEEHLSILHETIESDREQPRVVADAFAEREIDSVAILGLAYKGDVKVDILSPTVPIAKRLSEHGIPVSVHDPYYDEDHIEAQTGAQSIEFPEGLANQDAVLVVADHRRYTYLPDNEILEELGSCSLVLDNHRIWDDIGLEDAGVEYCYTGDAGWLSPDPSAVEQTNE